MIDDAPTSDERNTVANIIEAAEAFHSSLDMCLSWDDVVRTTLARLRAECPSVLQRFKITFRREEFVLDTHLVPVYEPLSAVDQLAAVARMDA